MSTDADETTAESPTPPPSGRSLLVGWAKRQDDWIRDLTEAVLQEARELSDDEVNALYERLLVEKRLTEGDRTPGANLVDSGSVRPADPPLILSSIKGVKRVNILAADQAIDFSPKMTVLFGRNGSGKTGYVRILNRLSSVAREGPQVLFDINLPSPPTEPPEAIIAYRLGESPSSHTWRGEAGVSPFTRLDVFDASESNAYVDGNRTYSYTPTDVALFRLVTDGIDRVRGRLDAAKKASQPGTNRFLSHFDREIPFFPIIDALGATTDLTELRTLAAVTTEEEESLDGLAETVQALGSKSLQAQVQAGQVDLELQTQARTVGETLLAFDLAQHNTALEGFQAAEKRRSEAARGAFAAENLPGFPSEEWRRFITAGENYISSVGLTQYPTDEERCLYCRQPLTAAALSLLGKYRDYSNDAHERAVATARTALDALRRPINETNLDSLGQLVHQRKAALSAGESPSPKLADATTVLAAATALKKLFAASSPIPDDAFSSDLSSVVSRLADAATATGKVLEGLTSKAAERDRLLKENSAKLSLLQARLKLRELLAEIETYVENAKWANRADDVLRRMKIISKSLTETSNQASERLMNQGFEKYFREECKLLSAPDVNLDFRGQKGQAARRKLLRKEYKLSQTLSEGEQKVIALADFLAEARLRETNAPVVFDDPVNSLDYERLKEVSARLAALAGQRQVIIFTHNIWFTAELLDRFRDHRKECAYYDVRSVATQRGIVSGGSHPRSDSVNDLKRRINTCIADARKLSGETQDALVTRAYSHLRSLCEVIVEREFLHGIIRRFEPNVMLTKLPRINPEAFRESADKLYPIYEDSCRYIDSHSQPTEQLNVVPRTVQELEKDFRNVTDALDSYLQASK